MVFWGLVDSAALEGRDKVQRNKNSLRLRLAHSEAERTN